MPHLEIILPILLVIMAFLLKLFVDQSATAPLIVRSTYELPVDIMFLAITFIAAFTISYKETQNNGLCFFTIFIIISILVVVMWRRSLKLFERNHKYWSSILFLINLATSSSCLIISISKMIGGGK